MVDLRSARRARERSVVTEHSVEPLREQAPLGAAKPIYTKPASVPARPAIPAAHPDGLRPDDEAPARTGRPEPTALKDRGSELASSGVVAAAEGIRYVPVESANSAVAESGESRHADGAEALQPDPGDPRRAQRAFIARSVEHPSSSHPHAASLKHAAAHGTHIRHVAGERFVPPSGEPTISYKADKSILAPSEIEREMKASPRRAGVSGY